MEIVLRIYNSTSRDITLNHHFLMCFSRFNNTKKFLFIIKNMEYIQVKDKK